MPWGFAAAAAGTIGASLIGANASQSAADTQAGAANQATQAQLAMFNQEQANVAPWLQAGQGSLAQLQRALGLSGGQGATAPMALGPGARPGARPGAPGMPGASTSGVPLTGNPFIDSLQGRVDPISSQAMRPGMTAQPGVAGIPLSAGGAPDLTSILRATPGYQWDVSQGLDAIMNKASAMGGVNSGATLKALSDYGMNQADNTYNQYIQNLMSLSNTGVNAGLGVAGIGAGVGQSIGGNMIGAGNALAAGQIGSANAISGGLGSIYNQYLMSQALNQGGGYSVSQLPDMSSWGTTGSGAWG